MKKKRIKKLIKVLKKSETFDQAMWFHHCGSPACIAGHTVHMKGWDHVYHSYVFHPKTKHRAFVDKVAKRILGLTDEQGRQLFWGGTDVSTEDAIKVLKHLLKTGKVDWTVISGEV